VIGDAPPAPETPAAETSAAETPASQPSASQPPPQQPAEPAAAAGSIDATALRRVWPDVLDVVKQTSRRTRALLDNAQIVGLAGETVTLSAPPALARMIGDDSNTSVLRAALTKVLGGSWRVEATPEGAAAGGASSAAGPGRAAEPEFDPRDDTEPDVPGERPAPTDPETEAIRLLQSELGARPVED
jgi:DNA polymerase-3 subunit gamma/tau